MESLQPVHSALQRLEPDTPPLWSHLHQQHDLRGQPEVGGRLDYGEWRAGQEGVAEMFLDGKREEFTEDPEADETSEHKETNQSRDDRIVLVKVAYRVQGRVRF